MASYLADTLRQGLRLPGPWVLLVVGVLAGWGGLGLAILALGEWHSQAPSITASTAQLFAVLATLWVLARLLDEDLRSPLVGAADCTAPGVTGRLVGRWLGASLLGFAVATGVTALLAAIAQAPGAASLRLWIANFEVVILAGAWGVMVACLLPGPATVLAGGLLWAVGHLPWGGPGLLEGRAGRALGALLPGPPEPALDVGSLAAGLAAALAVLLAALAVGGTAGMRR